MAARTNVCVRQFSQSRIVSCFKIKEPRLTAIEELDPRSAVVIIERGNCHADDGPLSLIDAVQNPLGDDASVFVTVKATR